MGRSSNCLKFLYFSIGIHYEGIVYSEYLSCPQVHLTSWGDVLQSAQSRQAQNVMLFSHMLNPVIHTESGLWLRKASSRAHLGHAHLHGELHWSVQELYESLPLGKWNDIRLTSKLFGCLQPTAQPAYSGHFGEHLPSL